MNSNVGLYDTFKDKDGRRFRVIEVGNDTAKLVRLNEDGTRKKQGGRPRILTIADLFANYNRVDLPPVTVTRQEPKPAPEPEPADELPDATIFSPEEEMLMKENEDIEKAYNEAVTELKRVIRESIDLKKTISKMQQAHDAEVAELNDRIMELEIIVKKKNEYADALDDDSEAFEDILTLAGAIQRSAVTVTELARMIQGKTEGRI